MREALARGVSREAIRGALRDAGWRADEIEAALRAWAESDFPVPVPRRRPLLDARDAFLYLVLFATLYTTAYNTGQVLFGLIERWVPDPLHPAHDWTLAGRWARGATAALIIAFPIYLALARLIGREVAREPEKRGSGVRRWLTYLTLLAAALVIIGDLTVLVTRVLEGELAPRFVLKVAVVFAIAATVFGHYLGDLRRDERDADGARGHSIGARLAAAAVFAVILGGLIFSGSPRQARWHQFDEQRVQALRQISAALQTWADRRGALPDSLGALLSTPDTFMAETLRDPETGAPYAYQRLDSRRYELCAEFRAAAAATPAPGPRDSEFWRHGPGRHCFTFEIAPRRETRP